MSQAKQKFLELTPGKSVAYEFCRAQNAKDFARSQYQESRFDRWNFRNLQTDAFGALADKFIDETFVEFGQAYQSMSLRCARSNRAMPRQETGGTASILYYQCARVVLSSFPNPLAIAN